MIEYFNNKKQINCIQDGIWLINDFFEIKDCLNLIEDAEANKFKIAPLYENGRHNKQTYLFSDSFYKKILDIMSSIILICNENGYKVQNINFPLEFYKYEMGDYIEPHSDAHRQIDNQYMTSLTLIIYLNDDFIGGETNFSDINFKVKPILGGALLFLQQLVHESFPILNGVKYILRTDIVIE